jgi:hypothetical protein
MDFGAKKFAEVLSPVALDIGKCLGSVAIISLSRAIDVLLTGCFRKVLFR